ncbi:fungal-specific transcription factor domain-containing protein [Ilyonectria destructans]|nr:fungal-specific transcription factor domain-containing protein [Ilyonectria destructans]
MVRRKRPYVPKVKGCYGCSQRRINCDGNMPSCSKCAARGIDCSGLNTKFRFRDGLARPHKTTATRHRRRRCSASQSQRSTSSTDDTQNIVSIDHIEFFEGVSSYSLIPSSPQSSIVDDEVPSIDDSHGALDRLLRSMAEPQEPCSIVLPILPNLNHLEPWKKLLLQHFSDNIAPEMVVVDDNHNGWRHLVLPVACADELIMNAVLAVSAFHLAGRESCYSIPDPGSLYARAIRALQNRRDLTKCDEQTKQFVVLAVVVLLVAVMVNGSTDFPIMFQMLQAAVDAVGGEARLLDGELAEFTLRQIHKMRVYAAPLLSMDQGVQAMLYQAEASFNCQHYYERLYPDHLPTFETITQIKQQAFNIYLDRILSGGMSTESLGLIHHFIGLLRSIPEGSLGEHSLVWPVFIAAFESSIPEHQSVFEEFLERQHRRNGFANVIRALELLRKVWLRNSSSDWPALLPEPKVFIM